MAEDINNSLFSQDVLDSMEAPHLFNQKHEGPVTVLGHSFDNDEERREYFRAALRKKFRVSLLELTRILLPYQILRTIPPARILGWMNLSKNGKRKRSNLLLTGNV